MNALMHAIPIGRPCAQTPLTAETVRYSLTLHVDHPASILLFVSNILFTKVINAIAQK